jgi:O-antigen/teichoic acid export membrane protein
MKIKFKQLIKNSAILSLPGIFSIFISLLSIPIHLNYAGAESYGDYIIFNFILMISLNFNFGIGKSTVVSVNNYPKKSEEINFSAINYTKNISIIFFTVFVLIFFLRETFFNNYTKYFNIVSYFFFGSIITIFFVTLEGILQGKRKFKYISIFNLSFFSLSISVPSILLAYNYNLTLENLILISILIKLSSVLMMFAIIKKNNLIKKSKNQILFNNLKKNSRWITLNSVLIQFYDLFDKYLIKFFLGPVAVATYSIPQQLTGKLSIISKSFSAFLLPNLSKRKIDNQSLDFSLQVFMKIIPVIIFLIIPFYPLILEFWLGNSFNTTINNLTKIFSISVIFSCASHLLITRFEATKTLNQNLKIEFFLMPFFLYSLYHLTSLNYSLIIISLLILTKEVILFFLRLNILNQKIQKVNNYYLYSILFLIMLYLSFTNNNFYFIFLLLLILNLFKK